MIKGIAVRRHGTCAGALAGLLLFLVAGCVPAPPPLIDAPLAGMREVTADWQGPPAFIPVVQRQPALVVVAVHGLKGSAGVFSSPAQRWSDRGILTYSVTLSYPDTTPVQVNRLIRLVGERHPGIPLMVVGESLGGSLVVSALARSDAPRVDGLVLAAPAVWPDSLSFAALQGVLGLIAYLPGEAGAPFWSKVIGLMNEARERAPAVRCRPILVLTGDLDEVVPRQGVDVLVSRLGAGAELRVYPNGGHTLFRNAGGEEVTDQVAEWMLAHAHSRASMTTASAPAPRSAPDQASAN
jgi:Lysophospholipase